MYVWNEQWLCIIDINNVCMFRMSNDWHEQYVSKCLQWAMTAPNKHVSVSLQYVSNKCVIDINNVIFLYVYNEQW